MASQEQPGSEGSEGQGYFHIVDEREGTHFDCLSCGKIVPVEGAGEFQLCDDCEPYPEAVSVAPFLRRCHKYDIDSSLMIWEGLPDEPEPWGYFKELPIWQCHPQLEHYKRIPLHKLEEQMRLAVRSRDGPFKCFVCAATHGGPPAVQQQRIVIDLTGES